MKVNEFLAAVEADEKALRESGKALEIGPEIADGPRPGEPERERLGAEIDAMPIAALRVVRGS